MPHIVIEYSSNIRERMELPALIERLHETAIATGVFPRGGARTRAAERSDYRIADGHPDNAFVHVSMMIGAGRDADTRKRAARTVFDALVAHMRPLFEQIPLGLTLEVRELDPELSFKHNNLHDHLRARAAGEEEP
ncbi:MAG: 5-carboxymethyl-2-hydroxymuconate Delta-isomerase [Burkholderiales bacterium]|nr:MAG: 5-carboxymethyl-2-hydroxymuconate Delta-isomerase [Burkholderiales bacterium]